jgi:uncharacterized protein with HEPN domain
MKRHDIPKSLRDILAAIDSIEKFLGPERDYFLYLENELLRSAVERKLEIIGEATNRILQTDPEFVIENARNIINLRNRVIHGYDSLDNQTIWAIVVKHLPPLKAEIEKLQKQKELL